MRVAADVSAAREASRSAVLAMFGRRWTAAAQMVARVKVRDLVAASLPTEEYKQPPPVVRQSVGEQTYPRGEEPFLSVQDFHVGEREHDAPKYKPQPMIQQDGRAYHHE